MRLLALDYVLAEHNLKLHLVVEVDGGEELVKALGLESEHGRVRTRAPSVLSLGALGD